MARNLISGLIFACLPQNSPLKFFPEFYLYLLLIIVSSYYPMQFNRKLTGHIGGNNEKPNLRPNFEPFGLHFRPRFFCVGFTSNST